MAERDEVVVLFMTAPDADTAARIARSLLEERRVACANIIPAVRSLYWWQGHLEESGEVLTVMKARKRSVDAIAARVRELHPYEVPEVVAVEVVGGLEAYLDWVCGETAGGE